VNRSLALAPSLLLCAALLAGCSAGPREKTPPAGNVGVSSVKKSAGISVTLISQPRVAGPGVEFSLTLNVRNLSGKSRTFDLPSSQVYEFLSFAGEGGEVWRWSRGILFAQAITPFVLAPDESKVFKVAWDPAGLPAGEYTVEGYFLGTDNVRPRVALEITTQ
jgi:hypothetical protein